MRLGHLWAGGDLQRLVRPLSVSGSTLTVTGSGTCVVAANQAGNADYTAAAAVFHSIVVNAAVLTVTANNASRSYGAANPTFSAELIRGS